MQPKRMPAQLQRETSEWVTSIDGNNSLLEWAKRATPFYNQSDLMINFNVAITSDAFFHITDVTEVTLVLAPMDKFSEMLHHTSKMKVTQIQQEAQVQNFA